MRMAIHLVPGSWARTIMIRTESGAERNMPGRPQRAPHTASESKTTSADIFRLLAVILGLTKLPMANCHRLTPRNTATAHHKVSFGIQGGHSDCTTANSAGRRVAAIEPMV